MSLYKQVPSERLSELIGWSGDILTTDLSDETDFF